MQNFKCQCLLISFRYLSICQVKRLIQDCPYLKFYPEILDYGPVRVSPSDKGSKVWTEENQEFIRIILMRILITYQWLHLISRHFLNIISFKILSLNKNSFVKNYTLQDWPNWNDNRHFVQTPVTLATETSSRHLSVWVILYDLTSANFVSVALGTTTFPSVPFGSALSTYLTSADHFWPTVS